MVFDSQYPYVLCYIGKHSMPILCLHIVSFKATSRAASLALHLTEGEETKLEVKLFD